MRLYGSPPLTQEDLLTGKFHYPFQSESEGPPQDPLEVSLRIDSKRARESTEMESWVTSWFETKTRALEQVDSLLLKYLEPSI